MRRSQTTLLMTLGVISSLLFMSQFPAISSVGNIHPDETTGEKPPTTDSDGDGIPDVHENLFIDMASWVTSSGRNVSIEGLDADNASDALVDRDYDGLNSTEEYCWPYPANCTEPGFPRGLTGITDPNTGERIYLDPRSADTDGDGLPDGYEAWMCSESGYLNEETYVYECTEWNPLNDSDKYLDLDEDGFDVDRNGILSDAEKLTGPEEYWYGADENWTTELDGLRCTYSPPDATNIFRWPYLTNGINNGLENILAACTQSEEYSFGGDLWLGTDPLAEDSDWFYWDGFSKNSIYPSTGGDKIPDGWEIHFGLDPLNKSNNLADPDGDGWDANKDGIISSDLATTEAAIAFGEAMSTFEEYNVFLDDGNSVKSGLRSVGLEATEGSLTEYPLSDSFTESTPPGLSLIHHDIKDFHAEGSAAWVGTRLGITYFDSDDNQSSNYRLPQGHDLNDMVMIGSDNQRSLVMATQGGLWVAEVDSDGTLVTSSEWGFVEGNFTAVARLIRDGSNEHVVVFGNSGEGHVVEISGISAITNIWDIGSGITQALSDAGAIVTSAVHVDVSSGPLTLYVGTDVGLMHVQTASARDSDAPTWDFFLSLDDVNTTNDYASLRVISGGGSDNPAIVRQIVSDGPSGGADQVLWIALRSGLHKLDLITGSLTHSGLLEHPGIDGESIPATNDIYSIYPTANELLIGSDWGLWSIAGNYASVYGLSNQEWVPGQIAGMTVVEKQGIPTILAGIAPGRFSNLALMDPGSPDSDSDGIPDGWEALYGLDPTDPYDAALDNDGDGINLDDDPVLERLYTNLDEFRYVATTPGGYNTTDPRLVDTDGDGVNDGAEFFGQFLEASVLWCHYDFAMVHVCDDAAGKAANETYLLKDGIDQATDPTNSDTDGDGMSDGWEIENRRWIGDAFDGGNSWTLDPFNANDKFEDADQDGLTNFCEYQWTSIREAAISGTYALSHGEQGLEAQNWSEGDPNDVDSDGDSLPDGWESGGECAWLPDRAGINPLNSTDLLSNPDGDGFDIDGDGVLSLNESYVNWLEFNIRNDMYYDGVALSGLDLPEGLETNLFDNIRLSGDPGAYLFVDKSGPSVTALQGEVELGASDPLSADTDSDGMPDGWEIWNSRWDVLADNWTLNPIDIVDRWGDSDKDGMVNWEEYNCIDPTLSETNANRTTPRWYVAQLPMGPSIQQWAGILTTDSFGSKGNATILATTGQTCDPNNEDTDGDGVLDGVELVFTQWDTVAEIWTLNPLVPGDGSFDADNDGLTDSQEFSLTNSYPENGDFHPGGTPLFHDVISSPDIMDKARVFDIIDSKGYRAYRWNSDYASWINDNEESILMTFLKGITDPTVDDSDDDGMSDGFEYWFTTWKNAENRWSMNPLYNDSLTPYDSDSDSWDCNGDGVIDEDETYTDLREYESRIYGKKSQRSSVPNGLGLISFANDTYSAYAEEQGISLVAAQGQLYSSFKSLHAGSSAKIDAIDSNIAGTFNRTLMGITDPTHADSDSDGIPDGWEYCYAIYGMPDVTTENHWSANPLNPFDVHYDGDHDGWYDRSIVDTPAVQRVWSDDTGIYSVSVMTIAAGSTDLPFTNVMEYLNTTRPDTNDSDNDSSIYRPGLDISGAVISYDRDWSLSDGQEIFKFGSNPRTNDSDRDFLPDWYEYYHGWNEVSDNFTTTLDIKVNWIDVSSATGASCIFGTVACLPLAHAGPGILPRPTTSMTEFTMDPAEAADANYDPDHDGSYDCSVADCEYTPNSNFMEFFGITNTNLNSNAKVINANLEWNGEPVTEWWQFRGHLLRLGQLDESTSNYFKMARLDSSDNLFAYVINDNDAEYLVVNLSNNDPIPVVAGNWTSEWEKYLPGIPAESNPILSQGERPHGWYILDIDDDGVADGSSPKNWDTDGDWIVDWFEVNEDEKTSERGENSPIRYDRV